MVRHCHPEYLEKQAQLCLPYVCLEKEIKEKKRKRVTYSDPIVNYSHPKVTFTILKMT